MDFARLFTCGRLEVSKNACHFLETPFNHAYYHVRLVYLCDSPHGGAALSLWTVSITIGIWLGSLTVRTLELRFDKQKNLIEIAGGWTPLILSVTIFSLRYFLGATYELYPDLEKTPALLAIENAATVVSGMFTGRLLGFWQRSKTAPHSDLSELKA